MRDISNLGEMFLYAAKTFGDRSVLEWKEGDEYKSLNGKQLLEMVHRVSEALEELGLKPNDKAAIISENRFEWIAADFACIINRVVTVPIYTTMTAEQTGYILRHSECKVCFVSSNLILEKVKSVVHNLPEMRKVVIFNDIEPQGNYVVRFKELLSRRVPSHPQRITEKIKEIDENDILTIIYTSGTTGVPKGVCLTHKNILSNLRSCREALYVDQNDVFLSFLPLAHSYERTAGYYFPMYVGAKVVYAQSIDTVASQMPEVKPTLMTAVPLFLHRMQARVLKSADSMPVLRRAVFKLGLKAASRNEKDVPEVPSERRKRAVWKLFDLLVYKKLRKRLGGRLRFFVSGGSALNKETGEFFDRMGIKILEGYGMTEASPVISVNREENYRFGTVGLPLNGVTVRIAEDGEILVKGDNVMAGYYRDEEETKKTIRDGWLHTGDIGEFDTAGRLKITDRKKTLFKTQGGKYISLTHIEEAVSRSRFIEHIMALGGDKPFVTALVSPALEELKSYADEHGLTYGDTGELAAHPEILKLMKREIDESQKTLAKYERVRRFTILPVPFTIEGGELTPTLKVKRKVVEEKYKGIIEEMYKSRIISQLPVSLFANSRRQ